MPTNPHRFTYEVPEFYMPYPFYGLNQHTQEAAVDALGWLDSYGVLLGDMRNHVIRTRPEITSGYYYPYCDRQQAFLATRFMAITFVIDDVFDDAITQCDPGVDARVEELCDAVWLRRRSGLSPLAWAMADLTEDINAGMSKGWISAFARDCENWIRAYAVESRQMKVAMPLCDYLPLRVWSFCSPAFFHLGERLHGIDVRPEIRELPGMQALRIISSQWGGLHNDVWSAEKEFATGYPHNAVIIAQKQRGVSVPEAVTMVNDMLTGLMKQYQATAESVFTQLNFECRTPEEMIAATNLVQNYHVTTRAYYDYYYDPQVRRYHPDEYMPHDSQLPLHVAGEITARI